MLDHHEVGTRVVGVVAAGDAHVVREGLRPLRDSVRELDAGGGERAEVLLHEAPGEVVPDGMDVGLVADPGTALCFFRQSLEPEHRPGGVHDPVARCVASASAILALEVDVVSLVGGHLKAMQ